MLNRRRWWILLTFLPLAFAAALVAIMLPSVYVSETLILVEPKEVPDDVVTDFVTSDTADRLVAIQETALSRTNLLRILSEFPDEFRRLERLGPDQQVQVLRQRTKIEFTASRQSRNSVIPYFRISYQDRNPALAQKVTERLVRFFIERDAKTREDQVYGTAEFLTRELRKVSDALTLEEQELALLKERFQYELPDQLDTNLRTLDRLQEDLKANNEGRDRYLSLKLDLERRISETSPVITRGQLRQQLGGGSPSTSPLVYRYHQTELALAEAKSRYTEKHPDVIRLEDELERLRSQIPPEDLLDVAPVTGEASSEVINEPNPAYQQLTSQLSQVSTELRILEERRLQIEASINRYTTRIENTPRREQEIAGRQRQVDTLQAKYKELEGKLSQATLASSLESSQKGEQFQVIDPASYPLEPAKPNRLLVLVIGIGAALGISIVVAAGVDFLDQRVWSANEVIALLNLPVVGEIPEIMSEGDARRIRRHAILGFAAYSAAALMATAAVYAIYSTPPVRAMGTETLARLLGW
jgi:polysaccharide chain length determinant protein (PEP-CTERM system associated)